MDLPLVRELKHPLRAPAARTGKEPPGPPGLPWFGNLRELRRNPVDFFVQTARTYGGIATMRAGRRKFFLISHPDLVKEALVDNRTRYMKNERYTALKLVLGKGLLLSEGDLWQRQRRLTNPICHPRAVQGQIGWMTELVEHNMERLAGAVSDGRPVDLYAEMTRMARTLIGRWLLGPWFAGRMDEFNDLYHRAHEVWPEQARSLLSSYRPPPVIRMLRLKRVMQEIDTYFYEAIRSHRATGSGAGSTMADLLTAHEAAGHPLSDQELRDQLVTLFIAGHETTASLLAWTWYILAGRPDLEQELWGELDSVLGGRAPTREDLPKLAFTNRLISEVLRLYSPIYSIGRVCLEEHTVGGYTIPAGASITVAIAATHRLAEFWEDPDTFDPGRFTPERSAGRSPFAFIPFGAGHRTCVGGYLTTMETTLVLSQVAQRFRFERVPGHSIDYGFGTVFHPRGGLPMLVRSR